MIAPRVIGRGFRLAPGAEDEPLVGRDRPCHIRKPPSNGPSGTRSAPRGPDHPRDHPFASMQRASNSARFCSAATPSNPAEAVSFDASN
jgi:hypothetical protein